MIATTIRPMIKPESIPKPHADVQGRSLSEISAERQSPALFGGVDFRSAAKTLFYVVGDHHLELVGDIGAAQRRDILAFDEHGSGRRFAGARKRDAEFGVLALARPIDDAAHHRDRELLDTWIALAPLRHRGGEVVLDFLG